MERACCSQALSQHQAQLAGTGLAGAYHAAKVLQRGDAAHFHVQERRLQLRQATERGVVVQHIQGALLILELQLQVGILRVVGDALQGGQAASGAAGPWAGQ